MKLFSYQSEWRALPPPCVTKLKLCPLGALHSGKGLEDIRPSPWHGALQCAAMTLVAKSLLGLMHIHERGIKVDTPTIIIAVLFTHFTY